MKNKNLLILVFIILLVTPSCTYVYYPTHPIIPDVNEDDNLGVQLTFGLTKAQLSAWYNIDSNLYVVGTVAGAISALRDGDSTTSKPFNAKAYLFGIGYKFPLSNSVEFNLQAGGGVSQGFFHTTVFNNNSNTSPIDINTQSLRGYLQPAIGFTHKWGGFFIIPRVTYEQFNSVKPVKTNTQVTPKSFLMAELFLMGRFKTKVVNVDVYGGFATNTGTSVNTDFEDSFVAQPFVFGIGISKTFGL